MYLALLMAFLTLMAGVYLFLAGLRAHRNGHDRAALVLTACLALVSYGAAHLLDRHWASAGVFVAGAAGLGFLQNKNGRKSVTTLSPQ